MTAYSIFSPGYAALKRCLSITIACGLSGLLTACATSSKPVETPDKEIIHQISLSEIKGRVLIVNSTGQIARYRVAKNGMILARGDRVITVPGSRAAITYSALDEHTETTEIRCTVRIPADSQFTIEDTEDCIAGSIIANNIGVVPAETTRPPLLLPTQEQRLAAKSARTMKSDTDPVPERVIAQSEPLAKSRAHPIRDGLAAKPEYVPGKTEPAAKPIRQSVPEAAVAKSDNPSPLPQSDDSGIAPLAEMFAEKQIYAADLPAYIASETTEHAADRYSGNLKTEPAAPAWYAMAPVSGISTTESNTSLYQTLRKSEKEVRAGSYEQSQPLVSKSASNTASTIPALVETAKKSSVSLSVGDKVTAGAPFEVRWRGPDQPYDYLTTVPIGAKKGAYNHYIYTKEGDSLFLNAPDEPGKYEVRYVDGATQNALARLYIDIE